MLSSNGLLLPVIVGIVSGAALILVFSLFGNQSSLNYAVVSVLDGLNVIKTEHVTTIANGNFTFTSDEYQPFLLVVPEDATDARLGGGFAVRGDNAGRVVALIIPQKDYAKFQAGESVNYYYNSGNVTSGRFNESIPSGQAYYLIIGNRFSTTESTIIQVAAHLSYNH